VSGGDKDGTTPLIRDNRKPVVFVAAGIFIFMILSRAQICAQQSDNPNLDSQFWPDTQANIRIAPNLNLVLFGTIRLGRNDSAFVNEQAGIGLNRVWGRYLSSSVQYRYIKSEPTPERQAREHRIHMDITPRIYLVHKFVLTDRNRVEWRDVNSRTSWRYRNRLQLERGMAFRQIKLIPYLAIEPYYDTRFKAWNRTQLFSGARVPITKHVTFDGFYMRQWDARVNPGFLHVIGAFWRLEF
jgi:hypothetical protein